MCGIVGYIGQKNASEVLIGSLKRLEYRGYDSSGIALLNDDKVFLKKRSGKLAELESVIDYDALAEYKIGIGHTRWATHGAPTDENSHPHTGMSDDVVIVHNGIIENYAILKKALQDEGHIFKSETDTEVVAHLIEHYLDKNSFLDSFILALRRVEGAYGIVAFSRKEPGKLYAARKGSPLLLGVGEGEMVLGSDASAIVEYTKQVIYIDDGELLEITPTSFRTYDLEKNSIEKRVEAIDWNIASIEKQGFDHFMLKEIFEQKETIENAFRGRILLEEGNSRLDGLPLTEKEFGDVKRIIFIACGTSWHAGLIAEYLIEEYARIPVEVEYASEFRYRNPILNKDGDLVITISQSGETADTLAALKEAKRRGVKVMSITNVVGSTIARESDGGIYLHAGPEIGVASTKAFTSQLTVVILLTVLLARQRGMTLLEGKEILEELMNVPKYLQSILQNKEIEEISKLYAESHNFLYLGRGAHFPVALEGALKLKEISYIHAEGYPAAEMKHGPIALIDENMPVVFIATSSDIYDKVVSSMEEVRARKGRIIAIADEGNESIKNYADHVIYIPKTCGIVSPLLTVVPLQLLSYHIAVMRGCDVDMPRNLAKSVTVE